MSNAKQPRQLEVKLLLFERLTKIGSPVQLVVTILPVVLSWYCNTSNRQCISFCPSGAMTSMTHTHLGGANI
jgi:hypothetical protein